ncbi:MAG: histidine phosphatase family protein [Synergistaceae bacterium]
MNIYLIRHAQSVTNDTWTWTGQLDVDISEKGIKQIESIKEKFTYPLGDLYISSPLKRCTQTMNLIYKKSPDIYIDELKECSLGILEGQKYTDLTNDENYVKWQKYPDIPIENGESFNQFITRTHKGFNKIIEIAEKGNHKNIIVLMHGNVMRAILHKFVNKEISHKDWEIPNLGIYKLQVNSGRIILSTTYPDFLFNKTGH